MAARENHCSCESLEVAVSDVQARCQQRRCQMIYLQFTATKTFVDLNPKYYNFYSCPSYKKKTTNKQKNTLAIILVPVNVWIGLYVWDSTGTRQSLMTSLAYFGLCWELCVVCCSSGTICGDNRFIVVHTHTHILIHKHPHTHTNVLKQKLKKKKKRDLLSESRSATTVRSFHGSDSFHCFQWFHVTFLQSVD